MSWDSDNPAGTTYEVEEELAHKKHGFRGVWTLVQTTTDKSVTMTRENGSYMYRVRASNSGGASAYVELAAPVDVSSGGGGGGGGGKGNGRNR